MRTFRGVHVSPGRCYRGRGGKQRQTLLDVVEGDLEEGPGTKDVRISRRG